MQDKNVSLDYHTIQTSPYPGRNTPVQIDPLPPICLKPFFSLEWKEGKAGRDAGALHFALGLLSWEACWRGAEKQTRGSFRIVLFIVPP